MKNKVIYIVVIIILIPVGILVYYFLIFKPLLESRGNFFENGRMELWMYYFDMLISNPEVLLFGLGCNHLSLYATRNNVLTAHNIVVEMFVELGIVGTLFYIYIITFIFRKAQKNPLKNDMMIPILMYGTFLMSQSGLSTELLYFLFALACQRYPKVKQQINDQFE